MTSAEEPKLQPHEQSMMENEDDDSFEEIDDSVLEAKQSTASTTISSQSQSITQNLEMYNPNDIGKYEWKFMFCLPCCCTRVPNGGPAQFMSPFLTCNIVLSSISLVASCLTLMSQGVNTRNSRRPNDPTRDSIPEKKTGIMGHISFIYLCISLYYLCIAYKARDSLYTRNPNFKALARAGKVANINNIVHLTIMFLHLLKYFLVLVGIKAILIFGGEMAKAGGNSRDARFFRNLARTFLGVLIVFVLIIILPMALIYASQIKMYSRYKEGLRELSELEKEIDESMAL